MKALHRESFAQQHRNTFLKVCIFRIQTLSKKKKPPSYVNLDVLLNTSTVMNTFWYPQSNDLVHSIQYFCMLSSILQANLLSNGFVRIYTIHTEDKRSLLSTPTTTLPLLTANETTNKTDGIIIMMIYTISTAAPSLQSGFTWHRTRIF